MSVINQMLKDLESRRQSGNDGNVLDGVAWHGDGKAKSRLPLLGLLVLVLAAVVAWLVYERNNNTIAQPPATPAAVVNSKPVPVPPVVEEQVVEKQPPAVVIAEDNVIVTVEENEPVTETPVEVVPAPQIFSVDPQPVPATGQKTEIIVRGDGFNETSNVFVSWRDGRRNKQLGDFQVNVDNEGLLVMTINPGRQTDDWTVRVENGDGSSSEAFTFRVEAQDIPATEKPGVASEAPVVKRARELSPADQADNLYSKARTQLSQGRRTPGEENLRRALEINPSLHDARKLLAGLLLRDGRNNEAAGLLDTGLDLSASRADFLLLRARIYTEQGNLVAATGLLESQQPALPQATDYYAMLAALYQRTDRHSDAVELYTNMLKLNPGQPVWNMGLGISLEATGDKARARAVYERALNSGLSGDDVRRFVSSRLQALK